MKKTRSGNRLARRSMVTAARDVRRKKGFTRTGRVRLPKPIPFFPDVESLELRNGIPQLPHVPGRRITVEMVKALLEDIY